MDKFEIVRQAMDALYRDQMPQGCFVSRIAEYDAHIHRAPNLWICKRNNPQVRYIATIEYVNDKSSGCVSYLGETVCDAVEMCLKKLCALH